MGVVAGVVLVCAHRSQHGPDSVILNLLFAPVSAHHQRDQQCAQCGRRNVWRVCQARRGDHIKSLPHGAAGADFSPVPSGAQPENVSCRAPIFKGENGPIMNEEWFFGGFSRASGVAACLFFFEDGVLKLTVSFVCVVHFWFPTSGTAASLPPGAHFV